MDEELGIIGKDIGENYREGTVILRGICPFCGDKVTFRQRTSRLSESSTEGHMIGIQCEGCKCILSYSLLKHKLYPKLEIQGLKDLPKEIQKYYDEGLRCISADSPNGAVTLFRKVIHALGIHYGIAKKNDDKNLYEIVKKLNEEGHIVPKLKDALLGIKDIGNDGAHINENEPNLEQAKRITQLIETVLSSTVIADVNLGFIKEVHDKKEE